MAKITVTESGTTIVVGKNDKVFIDIPGGGVVTIIADPNDNVDKFEIKFRDDSESDTVNIDLSTFSEDGLHIDIKDYDPADVINLQGAFNRYVDPDEEDEFQFEYVGSGGQTHSAFVHAKDGGEKDFTTDPPPIIICFAKGTEIETNEGARAIETLCIGDLVRTIDAGYVPVKWLGQTHLEASELRRWENLIPVRVKRNAFGPGRPRKDVVLSPNHRVLVTGSLAELCFGESEVLVPIKALIDGKTVHKDVKYSGVAYFHLLLEGHHIVETSGLLSESLFLGDQSMLVVSEHANLDLRLALTEPEWQRHAAEKAVRPLVRARIGQCLAA
tara:strand:- start:585 stop:1571 length:987 start_codon:yes stop_codon:yes gene_type:complete